VIVASFTPLRLINRCKLDVGLPGGQFCDLAAIDIFLSAAEILTLSIQNYNKSLPVSTMADGLAASL
jgi:hypothetical protein